MSKNLRMHIRMYLYWKNGTNTNTHNIWGPFYLNIRIFQYSCSSLVLPRKKIIDRYFKNGDFLPNSMASNVLTLIVINKGHLPKRWPFPGEMCKYLCNRSDRDTKNAIFLNDIFGPKLMRVIQLYRVWHKHCGRAPPLL